MGNLEYDTRFVLSDDVFCMPFICCCQGGWLDSWPTVTSFYGILQPGFIWKRDWSNTSSLCQRISQKTSENICKVFVVCGQFWNTRPARMLPETEQDFLVVGY